MVSVVFGLMGNDFFLIDYVWERVVFSKGVYFIEKIGSRFNLFSSNDICDNICWDYSWCWLLRVMVKLFLSENK